MHRIVGGLRHFRQGWRTRFTAVAVVVLVACRGDSLNTDPLKDDLSRLNSGLVFERTRGTIRLAAHCCGKDVKNAVRACEAITGVLQSETSDSIVSSALDPAIEGCNRIPTSSLIVAARRTDFPKTSSVRTKVVVALQAREVTAEILEYLLEILADPESPATAASRLLATLGESELDAVAARNGDPDEIVRYNVADVLRMATVAPILSEKVFDALVAASQEQLPQLRVFEEDEWRTAHPGRMRGGRKIAGVVGVRHFRDFDISTADRAVEALLDPEYREDIYAHFEDEDLIRILAYRRVFCDSTAATQALERYATNPKTASRALDAMELRSRRCRASRPAK